MTSSEQIKLTVVVDTGLVVETADRDYELKPLKWYLKTPFWGLKRFPYISEAADCDDRCTILKYEWLVKHLRKIRNLKTAPALPVFYTTVELESGEYHAIMMVVCKEGVKFIERTATTYQEARYKRLIKAHV